MHGIIGRPTPRTFQQLLVLVVVVLVVVVLVVLIMVMRRVVTVVVMLPAAVILPVSRVTQQEGTLEPLVRLVLAVVRPQPPRDRAMVAPVTPSHAPPSRPPAVAQPVITVLVMVVVVVVVVRAVGRPTPTLPLPVASSHSTPPPHPRSTPITAPIAA